ncbi:MAG: ATP-binding protein, partial [Muribaculaceae bacterium]|nr:ATP-binding protein [Muribaculaceae bacterium]
CGKASVLASVFLMSGPGNSFMTIMMNNVRGFSEFTPRAVALEFYRPDPHNEILISSGGSDQRTLKIEMIKVEDSRIDLVEASKSDSSRMPKSYGFASSFTDGDNSVVYKSQILVDAEDTTKARMSEDDRYEERLTARFVSSRTPSKLDLTDYKIVVENKEEKAIVDILRIIEPRVVDVQLVGEEFLVDIGEDRRFPVNIMGDGFVKIFNVILSIYYCSGGILIIDEIDNGFHYSVMQKLWKAIYSACERLNVQLFASTHSYDMIKAFAGVFADDAHSVAACKLIRTADDEIKTLCYDVAQLGYSLEQDIEMR